MHQRSDKVFRTVEVIKKVSWCQPLGLGSFKPKILKILGFFNWKYLNAMTDLNQFFKTCNPTESLLPDSPYYIDFSDVRGKSVVDLLKRSISSDETSTQLFAGHIGCGKSTELRRLQKELEKEDFHVVYFDSFSPDNALNTADIDITDILLVIAGKVSKSLDEADIEYGPNAFDELKAWIAGVLNIKIEVEKLDLSAFFAKVTMTVKNNQKARDRLRQSLESQTENLKNAINDAILQPANKSLKKHNKRGLVVIVDNLEKVTQSFHQSNRSKYLFVERGKELELECHVIYTIPLALALSEPQQLNQNFGLGNVIRLPMVPVKHKDGRDHQEGIALLKQMLMIRAFPDKTSENRLDNDLIKQIFDTPDTLENLCRTSGGHVRNLLSYLHACLKQTKNLPLTDELTTRILRDYSDILCQNITEKEIELLKTVSKDKRLENGKLAEYESLFQNLLTLEYPDQKDGSWWGINPILDKSEQCKRLFSR